MFGFKNNLFENKNVSQQLGSPIRIDFEGVIRNNAGSSDIMLVELFTSYHGMILFKNMGINEFVCYSDLLLCINLSTVPLSSTNITSNEVLSQEYGYQKVINMKCLVKP